MPDYKEMYLRLFRATEDAIQCLIAAQQECEEAYLASSVPELHVIESILKTDGDEQKK